MEKLQDADTRYFIEIDLDTLQVVSMDFDQKQVLDKGRQNNPSRHRLFLTKGQYDKFSVRCSL